MRSFKTFLFLLLVVACLGACKTEQIDLEKIATEVETLAKSGDSTKVVEAELLAERTILAKPTVRTWNDSLAHRDSLNIAYLYQIRTAHYYHTQKDTVKAVLSFMEALPWTQVWHAKARAQWWRFYANDIGEALISTKSPYLAGLAFDAFIEAEHYAYLAGDTTFHAEVLRTKQDLVRELVDEPDSVRLAFAPSRITPKAPADSFGLLAIALGFILLGGGGGTWYWWRRRNRSAAVVDEPAPALETLPSRFHTEKTVHLFVGDKQASRQQLLNAIWWVVFHPDELAEVRAFVGRRTQTGDLNQLSFCLAAGLLVHGLPEDEEQLATLGKNIRARLIRFLEHLSKEGWATCIYLPASDQAWRAHFIDSGSGEKPPF